MSHARKASLTAIRANTVFKDKVAAFHLGSYPEAEESHDAVSRCD
jgi:hypothetical protein